MIGGSPLARAQGWSPRLLGEVSGLSEAGRELGPADGLAEDAGTRRLWRRAAVVVRVVPSASARSVPSRLGLVPVTSSGLEGGPGVHVGPTRSWTDGALAPPCGLGGAGPCTVGALLGG